MKKSEIEALKEAFNIPEPERKGYFVSSFNEKIKKNKRSLQFLTVFRYASAAALAAVIIGLWGVLNPSVNFRNEPNNGSIVVESETTTAEASSDGTGTHTSTNITDKTEISQTTSVMPPAVTAVGTVTAAETETTVVAGSQIVTSSATTAVTPITTAVTESTNTPQTTTSRNTVENNGSVTTPEPPGSVEDLPGSEFGTDYTVSPSVVYDKTEDFIDISSIITGSGGQNPPLDSIGLPWELAAGISDYIVYAAIDEIIYTEVDGKPYTQENLVIYSVYKGDGAIQAMDRISLYVPGGYMPAEEYIKTNNIYYDFPEGAVIFDSGDNEGIQQVGDAYIFFLIPGNESMPDGAFQLTEITDKSVFEYRNGSYVSLGSSSVSFTEDELKEAI